VLAASERVDAGTTGATADKRLSFGVIAAILAGVVLLGGVASYVLVNR
jgi:hypothetical protein